MFERTTNRQHNIQLEHQTASIRRSRQRKQGLKTTTRALCLFSTRNFPVTCSCALAEETAAPTETHEANGKCQQLRRFFQTKALRRRNLQKLWKASRMHVNHHIGRTNWNVVGSSDRRLARRHTKI